MSSFSLNSLDVCEDILYSTLLSILNWKNEHSSIAQIDESHKTMIPAVCFLLFSILYLFSYWPDDALSSGGGQDTFPSPDDVRVLWTTTQLHLNTIKLNTTSWNYMARSNKYPGFQGMIKILTFVLLNLFQET